MKSTRIIVVFLFIIALYTGISSAAADASHNTEFRGILWGADLSAQQDMRRISCDDSFCIHVRSMEDLSMGEAALNSVTYRSLGGRFVEVIIEAPVETEFGKSPGPQSENFLAFKKICHENFGKTSFAASFENIHADQYRWEYTNIRKILKVNFNKNHMELIITDHDLLKQMKDGAAGFPSKSGENTAKPRATVQDSVENTPVPADAGDDISGGSPPAEEGAGKTPSGVKKTGRFLKWLFTPEDPGEDAGLSEEIRH